MSEYGEPEPERTDEQLIELVEDQRDLLIAVATGTSITAELDGEYTRRRRTIAAELERRQISNPLRWPDLRQFWASVAAPAMTTYRQRREHIHGLVGPLIERLERSRSGAAVEDWGETHDDWAELDQRIDALRRELVGGEELDDWQDVGRRAREILIDLANLLYRSEMAPENEEPPQGSNAKAKLNAYLNARVPGPQNAELRAAIRSAWDLANKVTHGSVTRHHAFAAAQATLMVVRTLAVIEADVS